MIKNKGITLVALIITIIILLILAGITIGQLTGNGIFENAKEAKEKWINEQEKEEEQISKYTNEIQQYVNGSREYFSETILWSGDVSEENQIIPLSDSYKNYKQIVFLFGDDIEEENAHLLEETMLTSSIKFATDSEFIISLYWYDKNEFGIIFNNDLSIKTTTIKATHLYRIIGLK